MQFQKLSGSVPAVRVDYATCPGHRCMMNDTDKMPRSPKTDRLPVHATELFLGFAQCGCAAEGQLSITTRRCLCRHDRKNAPDTGAKAAVEYNRVEHDMTVGKF